MSELLSKSDVADLMSIRRRRLIGDENSRRATLDIGDCLPVMVNGFALEGEMPAPGLSTWLRQLLTKTNVPLVWHEIDVMQGEAVRSCVQRILARNKKRQCRHVLLAGTPLDSILTFVALETLSAGFDVVLLIDLIGIARRENASIFWHRLFQAGAIPSTLAQVLQEWHYSAGDPVTTAALSELIEDYERLRPKSLCDPGLPAR